MNKAMVDCLRQFISCYKQAADKEAFIEMWETVLNTPDTPLTISDALDAAEGSAIEQCVFES